jgi:GR25 family glycosyltransferase involved in LPS biosynthesis
MNIYLINLDAREDRLKNVLDRVSGLADSLIRVSAITGEEIRNSDIPVFATDNTVANWNSHMKVLRLFLESDDEYCVVLEDDVLFINEGVDFLKKLLNLQLSEIDILQFGYLAINGRLDSGIRESNNRRKERILRILKILAVKTVSIFSTFKGLEKRIDRSRRILRILKHNEKLLDLNSPLVEGFEAGTHCYLINRKAASVLLNYNYPMLMGADLALIVLAVARNILITRTTSSYAIQDDSPVSIGEHSKLKLDLGTIIISAD